MKRNKFSLSNYKLMSGNMGSLLPCGLQEVLPGDSFQHSASALIRLSPLARPVMHPLHASIHHFFVPHRLVWNDWENFITGGPDGTSAPTFPTITFGGGTGAAVGSLADYLGVPPLVNNVEVSALPFRGYALIWNEWYRDQDLQTALTVDLTDGADTTTNTVLQNVGWEKDYFTSSRPFEQKGTEVTIPLTGNAPVKGIGKLNQNFGAGDQTVYESGASGSTVYDHPAPVGKSDADPDSTFYVQGTADATGFPNIYADLSAVSAASVNDLRLALALQRYKEARARYGSRYTEYLAYLGIRSSDARLQRPEYLGGGRQTIQFSEVLQTAPTTDGDDEEGVGNLKGHGIGALRSNRYRRFFEEHGYVFSFIFLRPKSMYVQGLSRHWNRRVKEDFWQQELQHIGQQAVLYKEVYAAHATPDGTFGYQDRYDEYRRTESSVGGEFRTSVLSDWHMARIFGSDPALNADFIKMQATETDRIFQVASTTADTLWMMVRHSLQARRLPSKSGTSFIF